MLPHACFYLWNKSELPVFEETLEFIHLFRFVASLTELAVSRSASSNVNFIQEELLKERAGFLVHILPQQSSKDTGSKSKLALQVFVLTRKAAEAVLGAPLTSLLASSNSLEANRSEKGIAEAKMLMSRSNSVRVEHLLVGETVGTGQFGMVKVARLQSRPDLFALKVCPLLSIQ